MQRFDGLISKDYELVPQTVLEYFESEDELAHRIAVHHSSPVVVDIGLGTGITTKAILARSPRAIVWGVDDEAVMIEQARHNLKAEIDSGMVKAYEGDAVQYLGSLSSCTVDVVASSYTLHNCLSEYRSRLYPNILRVLKPGGMFINNDKYASDERGQYVLDLTDQIERYQLLAQMGRDDLRRIWVMHEIEDQLPERIMWTDQTLSEMQAVGFTSVRLQKRVAQYAIVTAYKRD